jgi:putative transcriptional regulator
MNAPVNNNFGLLLAEKQKREDRFVPLLEVSKETGIARRTLYAWANNTVTRFDGDVIEKLCSYFGVGLSDLLEYIPTKTARK